MAAATLAAVAGRAEVMELAITNGRANRFVYLTGTLSGNPVGAVAGLATLQELRDKNLYTRIHESTNRLRNGLKKVFAEAGIIAQVTGEGGVLQVVFTDREIVNYQDILSGDKAKAMAVYTTAARQGLFMSVPDKIYVSAVHTDEDIDRAIQAFRAGVEAIA